MKDNFINDIVQEIKEKGYSRVENFISPDVSQKIENFMHKFNEENYNQENLLKRICFKREEGKNRQGDAYMVSLERNSLGSIQLDEDDIDDGVVGDIFKIYNSILEKFVGKKMDDNSRAMLNCQQYFDKSFAVADHYDGNLLDFEHGQDGYGDKSLIINKALLPRLVAAVVLRNENSNGTYVRPHDSIERVDIPNKSYDLIVFDNIKMRHGVPELEKPRMMIGFRNFDYYPYLFHKDVEDIRGWEELSDELNPGYILEIDSKESELIQRDFLKVWNSGLAETQLAKDAAF